MKKSGLLFWGLLVLSLLGLATMLALGTNPLLLLSYLWSG